MKRRSPVTSSFLPHRYSHALFGEGEQKDRPIGTDSDDHAKTTSPALARSGDPLLDDLTAKVSINQTPDGAINGVDQAVITDAVLPCCRAAV
jgi:hypothetical protein